jgi:hypothetical protein
MGGWERAMARVLKMFLERKSSEGIVAALRRIEKAIQSDDSPRGAAIVAAALVEDFLGGALRSKMIKMGPSDERDLFGSSGVLGSFSNKIKLASALGIIRGRTVHDLNVLREIRNAFAHTLLDLNFETPELVTMCKSFHCSIDLPDVNNLTPREIFAACVDRLILFLMSKVTKYDPGRWTKNIGKQLD